MRRIIAATLTLAWLATVRAGPAQTAAAEDVVIRLPPDHAEIARAFAGRFPKMHLSGRPLDAAVSTRAWTNYVASLDPNREFFLKSDIEKFREKEMSLCDDLRNGDLGFACRVVEVLRQRAAKRWDSIRGSVVESDAEWMLQKYLSAFAHAYDPYSEYLPPSLARELDARRMPLFAGIGAILSVENGRPRISAIVPGGPADRDTREIRLKAGDWLVGVGQGDNAPMDVSHLPVRQILDVVRGKKGTKVVLVVASDSAPAGGSRNVDLIRDEVKVAEQRVEFEVRGVKGGDGAGRKVGIMRVPAVYGDGEAKPGKSSAHDVAEILKEMREQGMDGALLDLRNNPGGSCAEAVRLAGLFIAKGPIVQVMRKDRRVEIMDDPDKGIAYAGPLVVLVNRLTASSAEVIAAALQDYGRAVIVGDSRTYGKGTCQNTYDLGRGSRLGTVKITTTVYFRVSGETPHEKGVSSDVVMPSLYDKLEIGGEQAFTLPEWAAPGRARYKPAADLSSIIASLREKSGKRRAVAVRVRAGEPEKDDAVLEEALAALSDLIQVHSLTSTQTSSPQGLRQ